MRDANNSSLYMSGRVKLAVFEVLAGGGHRQEVSSFARGRSTVSAGSVCQKIYGAHAA